MEINSVMPPDVQGEPPLHTSTIDNLLQKFHLEQASSAVKNGKVVHLEQMGSLNGGTSISQMEAISSHSENGKNNEDNHNQHFVSVSTLRDQPVINSTDSKNSTSVPKNISKNMNSNINNEIPDANKDNYSYNQQKTFPSNENHNLGKNVLFERSSKMNQADGNLIHDSQDFVQKDQKNAAKSINSQILNDSYGEVRNYRNLENNISRKTHSHNHNLHPFSKQDQGHTAFDHGNKNFENSNRNVDVDSSYNSNNNINNINNSNTITTATTDNNNNTNTDTTTTTTITSNNNNNNNTNNNNANNNITTNNNNTNDSKISINPLSIQNGFLDHNKNTQLHLKNRQISDQHHPYFDSHLYGNMKNPENNINNTYMDTLNYIEGRKSYAYIDEKTSYPRSPPKSTKNYQKYTHDIKSPAERYPDNKKRRDRNEYSGEDLEVVIAQKIQANRMKLEHVTENNALNAELYTLYSDLQVISAEFGITFDAPEIVVVGMQSDGKSSFIEGLLGFQFNIVDTNIGTRRPLIIQMINDPNKDEPICRFLKDSVTFGIQKNDFEEEETPVSELSNEIIKRTNAKAGTSKDKVVDIPIILRVQYKYCANLTIFDTPGFRLGGSEDLKRDIQDMVIRIAAPKHRIVVCLDQSTVEWVNTNSRPLVAKFDPNFSRTVIVNTKFDNRAKELRDAEATNNYLQGEGLPAGKKPFFISIPVKRGLDPIRFKKEMKECYLMDLESLLSVGFDEERFSSQIGIFNLKNHLESLVHTRYIDSIAPTLQKLDSLIFTTTEELEQVDRELEEADVEKHKRKVWKFIQAFHSLIEKLLHGSIVGNPELYGQTLNEEKINSSILTWPSSKVQWNHLNFKKVINTSENTNDINFRGSNKNFVGDSDPLHESSSLKDDDYNNPNSNNSKRNSGELQAIHESEKIQFNIPNNNIALYAGAQFHRLLTEFEYVCHSIEFPYCSPNEVASALGVSRSHSLPNINDAASDLAQTKCKTLFYPLVQILLRRASYIFNRMFDIALHVLKNERQGSEDNLNTLSSCDGFINELRLVYQTFLDSLIKNCEKSLKQDIAKLTTIVDWDLLSGVQELSKDYDYLNPTPQITQERVNRIMNGYSFQDTQINESNKHQVCIQVAGRLFSGIRFFFVKCARANLNMYLLDPMFSQLLPDLMDHFGNLSTQKMENLFFIGSESLRERKKILTVQLQKVKESRVRFEHLFTKLRSASQFPQVN